jgi:hypothetical protein
MPDLHSTKSASSPMNIIEKNIYFFHDFNKNFADFIKMTEKSPWQKE